MSPQPIGGRAPHTAHILLLVLNALGPTEHCTYRNARSMIEEELRRLALPTLPANDLLPGGLRELWAELGQAQASSKFRVGDQDVELSDHQPVGPDGNLDPRHLHALRTLLAQCVTWRLHQGTVDDARELLRQAFESVVEQQDRIVFFGKVLHALAEAFDELDGLVARESASTTAEA